VLANLTSFNMACLSNESVTSLSDSWIPCAMLPLVCMDGADICSCILEYENSAIAKAIIQIINLSANSNLSLSDISMSSSQALLLCL